MSPKEHVGAIHGEKNDPVVEEAGAGLHEDEEKRDREYLLEEEGGDCLNSHRKGLLVL
jgi:hypothetical protein